MRTSEARVALAAAVTLTLSIAGCSSSGPDIDDPEDTSPYRLPTSPENVIYNLNLAYVDMDADGYLACLADSFVFHLNPDDVGNPENPLPEHWGKASEDTIHHNMFADDSDVVSVRLTLTTTDVDSVPGPDPGGDDDRWLYHEQVDLRVTVVMTPENITYHATAPVEFLFQIDPSEVGPHGEQLWEIIHWWDLRVTALRVENASWGSIKSLWR
jgi:hypothetical protein